MADRNRNGIDDRVEWLEEGAVLPACAERASSRRLAWALCALALAVICASAAWAFWASQQPPPAPPVPMPAPSPQPPTVIVIEGRP